MNKRTLTASALLLAALLTPAAPLWAGDDMASMSMPGDAKTITLEPTQQDEVKARADLHDVRAAMAKHGMKETHHLMVFFSTMKDGQAITEGTVAVKVITPAGVKSEPLKMMLMGDGFGADVDLTSPGKYGFEVGTKLADGKKRVFTFSYEQK